MGLFYYEFSDKLTGGQLDFRPRHLCYGGHDGHYKFEPTPDDLRVPVAAGTALAFSNYEVAHKLAKVSNDAQENAKRSYIAFFVIDRKHKIPSTKSLGCRSPMFYAMRMHAIFKVRNGSLRRMLNFD